MTPSRSKHQAAKDRKTLARWVDDEYRRIRKAARPMLNEMRARLADTLAKPRPPCLSPLCRGAAGGTGYFNPCTLEHLMELDAILAQADTSPASKRVPVTFDKNGDPESGFIVLSRESEQFRAESKRQRIAGVRRGAVKKSQIDTKTEAGAEQLVDLIDENELAVARAVVVDWFGFSRAGKPAKFDKATADAVLAKKPTWRAAVIAALDDEAGFLPAQPTN